MWKNIFSGFVFTLIMLGLFSKCAYSQECDIEKVRLMFYNVENLFDIYDDTLKNDDDFLPRGVMRWNYKRYHSKINSLYKTIVAAGEWSPPAVVALCEIENRKVLEDLTTGTYLSKYDYNIIHQESPDHRGIDVCLIYRTDVADILEYYYWIPSSININSFTSRSILYAKMRIGTDTIHLFVNHWPSRRGGILAADENRKIIADMVKSKTDSIAGSIVAGAKIVILGDFNCAPGDEAMNLMLNVSGQKNAMVNISSSMAEQGFGTYRYRGIWEMIDQIIVSERLLICETGLYTNKNMFLIFRPDFLLSNDPNYPGKSPFSTYRGYRYQGGFSDHLPILIDLTLR